MSTRSKNIGKSTLESVNEQEEMETQSPQEKQPPSQQVASSSTQPPTPHSATQSRGFFGVRSYLHHFYEQASIKDPQNYEEFEEYRLIPNYFIS